MGEDFIDEEHEVIMFLNESGEHCPKCSDPIYFTDEVFLIRVVRPELVPFQGIEFQDELASDGDYMYPPQLVCFECWENVAEDMANEERNPYVTVMDDRAILECSFCESGIRAGEVMGIATFGEIERPERSPEQALTPVFQACTKEPTIICVSCMRRLNSDPDLLELWNAPIQEEDECEEGTDNRCWRYGCALNGYANCPKRETGT